MATESPRISGLRQKSKAAATANKKGAENVCDLCAGPFKGSEEVLRCEGNCRKFMAPLLRWPVKGTLQEPVC